MAEIAKQGRVIEARPTLLMIREGAAVVETTIEVKPHNAVPGNHVLIYDDGTVEVAGKDKALPDNVTEHSLPAGSADPDHS